jgi:putative membrane protein
MKPMNRMATLGFALGLAVAAVGAHAQPQEADADSKAFIKIAIEGNNAEIALGRRALGKGRSNAIKQFAQTLITNRQKANEDAKVAASAVGVKPPEATLVTIGTLAKLETQSGTAFDRSLIEAMVSDHRRDIKNYREQAGKNDAVGQYAKQTLPTLQKYLQEAERIQQQLNETTGSK